MEKGKPMPRLLGDGVDSGVEEGVVKGGVPEVWSV